nr:MAG TPA: hypothetical protein [Bacteriophage sp.]
MCSSIVFYILLCQLISSSLIKLIISKSILL